MINARELVGTCDVLLMTLDTLRYDVARDMLAQGKTPYLATLLPGREWEERHSPGSFTYAAHHAFLAGFLPTPITPGPHPRLFAARFGGSETTTDETCVFDTADIVTGFAAQGYHTVCIGGVGFFNKQTALGSVLPGLFHESHWTPALGVTDPHSTENQVQLAVQILARLQPTQRVLLFLNISAIHQPTAAICRGRQRIRWNRMQPRWPMWTGSSHCCAPRCSGEAGRSRSSAQIMAQPMVKQAIRVIVSGIRLCGRFPTPSSFCRKSDKN